MIIPNENYYELLEESKRSNNVEWVETMSLASPPTGIVYPDGQTGGFVEWREIDVPKIGYCWTVSLHQYTCFKQVESKLVKAECYTCADQAKMAFLAMGLSYWHH